MATQNNAQNGLIQELQTYSFLISEFQYDRAKKVLETQKEALKSVVSAPKNPLFSLIYYLINTEKSYYAMTFFFSKPYFSNKENARAGYSHMHAEIHRLLQSEERREIVESEVYQGIFQHICRELQLFASLRMRLLDFYANLYGIPERMTITCQDVLVALVDIKDKLEAEFRVEKCGVCIFSGLVNSMRRECIILESFLQAHELTSNLHFLEPLIRIHQANELLKQLVTCATHSDTKLWSRSHSSPPALVQWLQRFQSFLLSKYSLYFHDVLKHYSLSAPAEVLLNMNDTTTSPASTSATSVTGTTSSINVSFAHESVNSITNSSLFKDESASNYGTTPFIGPRLSPNCNPRLFCMPSTPWISRIVQYQKTLDVYKVAVIFDAVQQSYPYLGQGYVPPGLRGDTPSGINSFPIIYQYPPEPPLTSYDRVVIVTHVSKHLTYGASEEWEKVLREVDNSSSRLYYMSKLETRMFLVSIFDSSPHISATGGFGSGKLACTVALALFGTANTAQGGPNSAQSSSSLSIGSGSLGSAGVNTTARLRLEALDSNVKKFHKEFAHELRGCGILSGDFKETK